MSEPTFGISITRVDNEPRPAVWSDMAVVGIIGTAPDADADDFPVDTPVFMYSDDAAKRTALGALGTIAGAIKLINAQLGEFQVAAKVVVVRVAEGADADETIVNIVGDGTRTGLAAFVEAGPLLGVIPRLLCAPGFTSQREGSNANPVCAALPAICAKLLAHAVVDGPATTEQAALDWRETLSSDRLIPVDPAVKILSGAAETVVPMSPAVIGIAVRRDHEKQGRPFHSWANQPIHGIVGPSRPINFSLTDGATEGQRLLAGNVGVLLRGEMGVETAIASGGFVFVGTDNAGEDDLWRFYNVTRGRDFIHLMFLRTLRYYLGRFNITGQTVQAVVNTMSFALRDLKADGDILGYEVKFTRDQNSPEQLRLGKFTINFAAEEAPVLRYLGIQSARYRPALDALLDDLLAQVDAVTG
ncbi:MAG: phage tail protein [Bauldia sp.]|nr:phage tail protein [Bauldia sp.]